MSGVDQPASPAYGSGPIPAGSLSYGNDCQLQPLRRIVANNLQLADPNQVARGDLNKVTDKCLCE